MNNSNNVTKTILLAVIKAVEGNGKRISAKNRSQGTKIFYEKLRAGFKPEIAIQAMLGIIAENAQAWEAGMEAFKKASTSVIELEPSAEVQEQPVPSSEEQEAENAQEDQDNVITTSEIPVEVAGIERAVKAATEDESLHAAGIKAYVEAIRSGQDTNDALDAALDAVTQDEEAWARGQAAFYEESEVADAHTPATDETSTEGSDNKAMWWIIAAIVAVLAIIGFTTLNHKTVEKAAGPVMVDRAAVLEKATLAMYKADWKPGEFVLDDKVDPTKDKSTAGNGSFDKSGIKNAQEMVSFLGSGSTAANAAISQFANESTGASKEEVLDPNNWVTVQSLKAFTYPANTLLRNGTVAAAGVRKGGVGDIFMLFVSPHEGSKTPVVAARGACVNPQGTIPVPNTPPEVYIPEEPVVPPTEVYLQPKSSDPDDYKYPAKKPEVTAEKKAEKKSPEVDSRVEGESGVVDKPSNEPGSESGVVAPDAKVVDEDIREKAPEEEKGVNPNKNDETNVVDPGLPQGF